MKAIRYDRYGGPEVLELRDVPVPVVGDDDLLVRVRAAAVNPLDYHFLHGTPYLVRAMAGLSRPKVTGLGADMAGRGRRGRRATSPRTGPATRCSASRGGGFAEYVAAPADWMVAKPAEPGFRAGVDHRCRGRDRAAGAARLGSGGGGPARAGQRCVRRRRHVRRPAGQGPRRRHVTAVCSTHNVETAARIGADRVVDYTREDSTATGERYDLIFDNAGSRTLREMRRVLTRPGAWSAWADRSAATGSRRWPGW